MKTNVIHSHLFKTLIIQLTVILFGLMSNSSIVYAQIDKSVMWQQLAASRNVPTSALDMKIPRYREVFEEQSITSPPLARRLAGGEYYFQWRDIDNVLDGVIQNYPNFRDKSAAMAFIENEFPNLSANEIFENRVLIQKLYEDALRHELYEKFIQQMEISPPLLKTTSQAGTCDKAYQNGTLTEEEFWLLISHPFLIDGSKTAVALSVSWTEELFPNTRTYMDKGDAYRHAALGALVCSENGNEFRTIGDCLAFSQRLTDAHEIGTAQECQDVLGDARDDAMDYHNNRIGRNYVRSVAKVENALWILNKDVVTPNKSTIKNALFNLVYKPFTELVHLTWFDRRTNLAYFSADPGGPENRYCGSGLALPHCIHLALDGGPVTIGVIKHDQACYHGEVFIFMDDQDDEFGDPNTSEQSSVPNGITLDSKGNTRLKFCKEPIGGRAPALLSNSFDYILLRLSNNCPDSSYPFRRHIDNEDENNTNGSSGSSAIAPSVVNSNTDLEFCFVPAQGKGWDFTGMPWTQNSGIFAADPGHNLETYTFGSAMSDDEDDNNENAFVWYGMPLDLQSRANNIILPGKNTLFRTAYQTNARPRLKISVDENEFYVHDTNNTLTFESLTRAGYFYSIEVTTDKTLFSQATHGHLRNDSNFFSSWWGSYSAATSGSVTTALKKRASSSRVTYTLPSAFWHDVEMKSHLYYRLFTSSDLQGSNFFITTSDSNNQNAPAIALIAPADINRDGCVDRQDLQEIVNVMQGTASFLPAVKYDLNSDSVINVLDARKAVVAFSHPLGTPCG